MKKHFLLAIAALSLGISSPAQSEISSGNLIETPHISAPEDAFAPVVLMPGDPFRAKYIAETFLEDAQLVTSVRNMLGYTGTYKGVRVSVMGSGMGMPSMGIYSWELYTQFGVEDIIRVGSAGSYNEELEVMDVALAESSTTESTYAQTHNGETSKTLLPSQELNEAIKEKAIDLGINLKMSKVRSSDVFYTTETWQDIVERTGTDCVEMESFALFHNAAYLGKRAACLLTISDSFVTTVELSPEDRERSFDDMIRLALETAISRAATGTVEISASESGVKNGKYAENEHIVIYKEGKRYNTAGIEMK